MKKLTILYLVLICSALSSCSMFGYYNKETAINKFCNQDSATTIIKDTIRGSVQAPEVEIATTFDCDKFRKLYDSLLSVKSGSIDTSGFVPIFEDSNGTVFAKPNADGSTTLKTKTKAKEIPFAKPFEKVVTVPCNCPEVCPATLQEKAYAARWFMIGAFVLGCALGLFIIIRK